MRNFYIALIIALMPVAVSAQVNATPKPRHNFTVIAHRGDHVTYPENTMEAYAEAMKNDIDYVEIDLRTTRDGKLISMHDATVNRMTNGKGAVKDMTLDEIAGLEIKSADTTDKTIYRVPTFEQIMALCKNKIYIYIDFKQADAGITYDMLKKYGMEKQVIVYINSIQQFLDWRKAAPGMPLMVSMPASVKDTMSLQTFIVQQQPDILDGSWKEYTTEMIALAKAKHLTVWPDIQSKDEAQYWQQALDKGFSGLQTDHPAMLVKFLKEKGIR